MTKHRALPIESAARDCAENSPRGLDDLQETPIQVPTRMVEYRRFVDRVCAALGVDPGGVICMVCFWPEPRGCSRGGASHGSGQYPPVGVGRWGD